MRPLPARPGLKAGLAAVLLVFGGILSGVALDRVWLRPASLEAMPLTADAMATRLRLSPTEAARIGELLDSLHNEVIAAGQFGPDSLRIMADRVHERIEATLPSAARSEFREWIGEHHDRMMERLGHGGGSVGPPH